MGVKCKVCMKARGRSATFASRAAVVKHRRRKHPNEPKAKQWPKKGTLAVRPRRPRTSESAANYCTQCGRKRKFAWKYCAGCGAKLS